MRFYKGTAFPTPWQSGRVALIAEHGSWNRGTGPNAGFRKIGYRVAAVELDANGDAVKHGVFMCGFLEKGVTIGRPVDVQELPDGSVLISDDTADQIYRVKYTGSGASDTEIQFGANCEE